MSAMRELRRVTGRAADVRRRWGIKRGVRRGVDKLRVYAMYPVYRSRLKRQSFQFRNQSLPFFVHHYNATWRSERLIEIPIARRFLRDRAGQCGLEVGNVLGQYQPISHSVIDKYERAPGVQNVDVVDYEPDEPLDWILAISTLEHVGWDETPRKPEKLGEAVRHLRSLLKPGGTLLVTSPRGVNSYLDEAIATDALGPATETFLHRDGGHMWREESRSDALQRKARYDDARRNAFDLWVAEFESGIGLVRVTQEMVRAHGASRGR
jgi:hypothetical protein